MIISEQSDFRRYASVNKHFSKVCDFLENTNLTEDEMLEFVMEVDAEDLKTYDEVFEIITEPSKFSQILQILEEKGIKIMEANISMIPENNVELDQKSYEKIERLVEMLEDNDDVQNVYHNAVEEE